MTTIPLSIQYLTSETKALESLKNRLKADWPNLLITQGITEDKRASRSKPDIIIIDTIALNNTHREFLLKSRETPIIVTGQSKHIHSELNKLNGMVYYLSQREFKGILLIHTIKHLLELRKLADKLEIVTSNLRNITIRDDLTGLYNKRYIDNVLEMEFKKAVRYKSSVTILLIGIDGLKNINEIYGYEIGNKVLCEFAVLIQNSTREVDTVARLGGGRRRVRAGKALYARSKRCRTGPRRLARSGRVGRVRAQRARSGERTGQRRFGHVRA